MEMINTKPYRDNIVLKSNNKEIKVTVGKPKNIKVVIGDVVFEVCDHPLVAADQKPEVTTHWGYKREGSKEFPFMHLHKLEKQNAWKASISLSKRYDSFQICKYFSNNFNHLDVVRWGLELLKDNDAERYENLIKLPINFLCTKGDLETIKLSLEYAVENNILSAQEYDKLNKRINELNKV